MLLCYRQGTIFLIPCQAKKGATMEKEPKRMFKRVNVLGLDFYVDWLDVDG